MPLGRLPYDSTEVGQVFNDYRELLNNYYDRSDNNQFFSAYVAALQILYKEAFSREQHFFKDVFNKDILSPKDEVKFIQKKLQTKINNWNKSGAHNLLTPSDDTIKAIKVFLENKAPLITGEEIKSYIKTSFSNGDIQLNENGIEVIRDQVISAIASKIQQEKNVTRSAGKRGGLNKLVTVTLVRDEKTKKNAVDIQINEQYAQANHAFAKNITKFVKGTQTSSNDAKTQIIDLFSDLITSKKILSIIRDYVKTNVGQLDVNTNPSSIKGFLGEVYWGSFLSYISPNSTIYATGGIREQFTGAEISIDTVLSVLGRQYNFQIKNYKEAKENNFVSFRNSMKMHNFIYNRAEIQGEPAEILDEFFGSIGFNFPLNLGDSSENNAYQKLYANMVNSVYNNQEKIDDYLKSYVPFILRVAHEFSTEATIQKIFQDPQIYLNNFFLLGNTWLPGSAILYAILESIAKTENKNLIQANFTIKLPSQADQGASGKINQEELEKPYWVPQYSENDPIIKASNKTKVDYTITILFDDVLKKYGDITHSYL